MWPGFGDNIRVVEWIFDRCSSNPQKPVEKTSVGYIPGYNGIQTNGIDCDIHSLLQIEKGAWKKELEQHELFLKTFGKTVPNELWSVHESIQENFTKKLA
jgi:phosphoenolpyruvate carboxykinase (GTP)